MFNKTSFVLLFIIGVTLFINNIYSERVKRNAQSFPVSTKTKKQIQRIIAVWKYDELRNGLKSGSLYTGVLEEDKSSRIDNQSPITKDGMPYYNVQVQLGSNTYSTVFIPSGQQIGQRQIRNAFVQSLNTGKSWMFKKTGRKSPVWAVQPAR